MSIVLHHHPKEAELVGLILTGYADIEYAITICVGSVLGNFATALRCLFRLRGGDSRLQVADAIMRPALDAAGLKSEYDVALCGMRYSTKIRNQFAHSHWMSYEGAGLYFTDFGAAAKTSSTDILFKMRHVDCDLLRTQSDYILNCADWLHYLNDEFRVRVGKSSTHTLTIPDIKPRPPLHNPPEEHPLPRQDPSDETPPKELPPETSPE